jgi:hypothetical protein
MAVRIIIEKGPDQGKTLQLDARAEMRIGRAPGNHLMVQDPTWQGTLRVSFSQGVCKVTNQTPTTIYLGGKIFPPGEQRAWFHGESLQPTAQSLLVLYVENAARVTGEAKRGGSSRKAMQITVIFLCVLVAGLLSIGPPAPPGAEELRTPEQKQRAYQRLETQLQELQERVDGTGMAKRVLTLLREARFEQVRANPAQAFKLYHRIREEVETNLGTPEHPRALPEEVAELFRRLQNYVNQQLIELGPEARKRSG